MQNKIRNNKLTLRNELKLIILEVSNKNPNTNKINSNNKGRRIMQLIRKRIWKICKILKLRDRQLTKKNRVSNKELVELLIFHVRPIWRTLGECIERELQWIRTHLGNQIKCHSIIKGE